MKNTTSFAITFATWCAACCAIAPVAAQAADLDAPLSCERALLRVGQVDTGLMLRIRGVFDAGSRQWIYNDASGTGRRSFSVPPGVYLVRFTGAWMGDMSVHAPAGAAISFDATVSPRDLRQIVVQQHVERIDGIAAADLPASFAPASALHCAAALPVSKTATPR